MWSNSQTQIARYIMAIPHTHTHTHTHTHSTVRVQYMH